MNNKYAFLILGLTGIITSHASANSCGEGTTSNPPNSATSAICQLEFATRSNPNYSPTNREPLALSMPSMKKVLPAAIERNITRIPPPPGSGKNRQPTYEISEDIKPEQVIYLLIQAVKEQQAEIEKLKNQLR